MKMLHGGRSSENFPENPQGWKVRRSWGVGWGGGDGMWRDLAREGGGGPCVVKRDFFLLCPLGHSDLFPTAPTILQALGRALAGRSHGALSS